MSFLHTIKRVQVTWTLIYTKRRHAAYLHNASVDVRTQAFLVNEKEGGEKFGCVFQFGNVCVFSPLRERPIDTTHTFALPRVIVSSFIIFSPCACKNALVYLPQWAHGSTYYSPLLITLCVPLKTYIHLHIYLYIHFLSLLSYVSPPFSPSVSQGYADQNCKHPLALFFPKKKTHTYTHTHTSIPLAWYLHDK